MERRGVFAINFSVKLRVAAATLLLGGVFLPKFDAVGQEAPRLQFADPIDVRAILGVADDAAARTEADRAASKEQYQRIIKMFVGEGLTVAELDEWENRLKIAEQAGATKADVEKLTKQLMETARSEGPMVNAEKTKFREEWERRARLSGRVGASAIAILGLVDFLSSLR